jgi:hypothetical protein
MPVDAEKLRVLIPTTSGTVEVLLLTEEDPSIRRSVACIGGTTETADIAAAYNAFVARPTGIIEGLFGHPCYRLDVSGPIDAGSSWQLGILIAHALHAEDRLAQEKDTHAGVIWATGSVRPVDLTVGSVSHIPEKIANSIDCLKLEAAAGRRVLMAIPDQNALNITADQRNDLAAAGVDIVEVPHAQYLFQRLGIALPNGPRRGAAEPAALPKVSAPSRNLHIWGAASAAALALFGLAAAATWFMDRLPPGTTPDQASARPPTQNERLALVPEMVPFVSDRDRATIRAAYMSAPDHKALAVSSRRMGFATAQPNDQLAKNAALAACQVATDRGRLKRPSRCELYATGTTVVFGRGRPPMPPQPWFVRDPSIERPFVAADVPLISSQNKKNIERYEWSVVFKAVAISPTGVSSIYTNMESAEHAARSALERCGYHAGVACMVIALDDNFIVPIPKSMRVIGFYHPDALGAVAPELRENVARRLGNAPQGWNALAIGAGGQVGIKLNAASEQSAIEESLQQCSKRDRECRVAVLGPFLVERQPSKSSGPLATPAPVSRTQTSDEADDETP